MGKKLTRLIAYFLLVFSASCAFSADKTENFGIAFVHGTNDHREDAETEYWKKDFTDAVADVLPKPENKFIAHCDFTHYMWDEATSGCVAEQLLQFIDDKKITKLVIYTHSNGGNVMRWILSNPTYDARFMRLSKIIKQVIALAPSSGGTSLADDAIDGTHFETGLGWLLGYVHDAVRQQRVGDMAIFNDEVIYGVKGRPSLPIPFRAVVGSDVVASPFKSSSYCNGYWLNASLKVIQTYLSECSDGYLDCSSQAQAGTVWFYDYQKTDDHAPLNHNQSRHACVGFEQILRNDLVLTQGESQ
ncbi:MAG: hypothetical protein H0U73_01665 [Tatlockia sp.]|nr:hypothetical protein [Tatlockia sp.]